MLQSVRVHREKSPIHLFEFDCRAGFFCFIRLRKVLSISSDKSTRTLCGAKILTRVVAKSWSSVIGSGKSRADVKN